MSDLTKQSSHWQGCHYVHMECARSRIDALEAALRESVRDFDLIANWRDGAAKYDADMGNPPRTFCEDVELIEQSAKEAADEARALLGEWP